MNHVALGAVDIDVRLFQEGESMSDPAIVFDADQYNLLITTLTTVIDGLQETTVGPVALQENVKLQPEGQTWSPAVELVAAGTTFFSQKHASVTTRTLPRLTALRDSLLEARTIFPNLDDFTAISRVDFVGAFPDLDLPTSNRAG